MMDLFATDMFSKGTFTSIKKLNEISKKVPFSFMTFIFRWKHDVRNISENIMPYKTKFVSDFVT